MSYLQPILDAIDRLKTKYNSNAFDAATNPGGFANDGHVVNFPAALADVSDVGAAVGDAADAVAADALATAADRVATGDDATGTAADALATAADRVATGDDATSTAADALATAADRVATGDDATGTAADALATAADRVATGDDATATAADALATALAKTASETARDKSQKWADEIEDTEVEVGKYSSLHHAAKAGASALAAAASAAAGRERLTAVRTYYVRTDGNDLNDGLADTSGGAFLTIQKAYDVIVADLDTSGHDVDVEVGNGTYTAGLITTEPWVGGGQVTFRGDTVTPSNVFVSVSSAGTSCFETSGLLGGDLKLEGFKTTTSVTALDCISHGAVGTVVLGAMEYGESVQYQIFAAANASTIEMFTDYEISGGGIMHWLANVGALIQFDAAVTLTGTPNFAAAFGYSIRTGKIEIAGGSFTGAATGKRHHADVNGVIVLSGKTLPGDSAGTTSDGGIVV